MAAGSARVRHLIELVTELTDEERSEFDSTLNSEDESAARAWGPLVDDRAERAQARDYEPLSRARLTELLNAKPDEARAALSELLPARR